MLAQYCATKTRKIKDLIARQVMAAVFKRNIKFIRQLTQSEDTTCWVAVTQEAIIMQKIKQTLRDRDPAEWKSPSAREEKKHESQQQDTPRDWKNAPVASQSRSKQSLQSDDCRPSKKRRPQEGSRSGGPIPLRESPRESQEVTERTSVASSQQLPLAIDSHLPLGGLLYQLAAQQQQQQRIPLSNYSTADLLQSLQLRQHDAGGGLPFGTLPSTRSLAAQQQQQPYQDTIFSSNQGGLHPLLRVENPLLNQQRIFERQNILEAAHQLCLYHLSPFSTLSSSSSLNVAPTSSADSNLASSTIDTLLAHHRSSQQELSLLQLQQQQPHQRDSSKQEPEEQKEPFGSTLMKLVKKE